MNLKKERDKFHNWLRAFIKVTGATVTDRPADGESIILCTAVEDFEEKSNLMWQIDANKSYPRDAVCRKCLRQVVMSNGMYEKYLEGGKVAAVECGGCIFGKLKGNNPVYDL